MKTVRSIDYINPYEFDIVPVDTRAQKYEMADLSDQGGPATSEAIQFLSRDGIPIRVEVSVLFSIQPENAPYVVATLGKNLDDVKTKIIRPGSRAFVRIEGSMLNAEEFLNKEMRKMFQDKLMESLRAEGARAKVTIANVFVRNYTLPEDFLKKK
jgi:regulator of protease activity HflC (stomatin/prohibitin superfamily)